jgi:hypothetical protein
MEAFRPPRNRFLDLGRTIFPANQRRVRIWSKSSLPHRLQETLPRAVMTAESPIPIDSHRERNRSIDELDRAIVSLAARIKIGRREPLRR